MSLFGISLVGWLVLGMMLESAFISLAIVLAVAAAIYFLFGRSLNTFQRMYFVPYHVAHTVVKHVLEHKNLPYKRFPNKYQISGNDVFISVKRVEMWRERPSGVIIQIGPTDGEEIPLVMSMREKLDEAFLPKGLD